MTHGLVAAPERAPLLATRLEPAPLPPTYGARDRLAGMLASGAVESCQLTLVSAPAGYGKTMAVRGWLEELDRPFAWLTIDEGDDDPVRLVRYLIAALARVRPGIGPRTTALLGMSGLPSIDLVVATLLDEVAGSDAPFTLVLDDYHLLAPGAGRDVVGRLIAYAPPFIQIVLVTRQDPDFPLARLRAHGRVVEIRADDLRFRASEATALLTALGVELEPPLAGQLADRTEGWAAGLQLAALSLRDRPDAPALIASFGATHRYVIDYLADEVIGHLSDDLRSFLERTSVTERLCAGLADALTGRKDGEQTLRAVEEQNLFLLPLGPDRSWYRYHQLFSGYLRSRLDDEERRDLQIRAAEWCDREGLTSEATRYALASDRWPAALPIVVAGAHAALALGEPNSVIRWTMDVPPSILRSSADLLADRGWAAFFTQQRGVALAAATGLKALDDLGRLEGPPAGRARGIMAWIASSLDGRPEEGVRLARQALDTLQDDPFFRELTLLALGDASWDLGRVDENAAANSEALRLARKRPPSLATYFAGYLYALAGNEQGRRAEADRMCRELLAESVDSTGRTPPVAGPVRVGLGLLAYEANDLETAATEFEAGFAMCKRLGIEAVLGGESRRGRAMTRLATAGADAAMAAATEGIEATTKSMLPGRFASAEAVVALVALRSGDARTARRWAERVGIDDDTAQHGPPNVRLYRDLTLARVLLATGQPRRAERAAIRASRLATWAGSALGRIQASILASVAAEQLGRRADARSRLTDAVTLAAPGWYLRRFAEDAPPIAHLLPTVRGGAETFVDAIGGAFAADGARSSPGRSAAGPAWRAQDGALLELLTQRELDVLRLLARGRSNAGIGDALGVSAGTAKWHVANVLSKLGATSRTQAAARARDLGLV